MRARHLFIIGITLFSIISLAFTFPKNLEFSPKPIRKTTISFEVQGNCGECKERIEKALDKKGIYKAIYNIESNIVTISYDPTKLQEIQLHNIIAMVGHDTDKVKASNVVYQSLPDCCKYRKDDDEWGPGKH
jgi:copper chaperone CopZ